MSQSLLVAAVADARAAADERERSLPLAAVRELAATVPAPRAFRAALGEAEGVAVIAEVKRRSPSAGLIRADLDPAALARSYVRGGAAGVSVLTERVHFGGSLDDLRAVRAAVTVPLLRKDFITTAYQVWEARAAGADAILLIVAALAGGALEDLLAEAAKAGLDALVEVHDRAEAKRAAATRAAFIGVNARDLHTLRVDQGRFRALRDLLPADATLVAESGIRTRADVELAVGAGAHAVLVGESLVRAHDPELAVASLVGRVAQHEP